MTAATLPVLAPWTQRMMVVDRRTGATSHRTVEDLAELLGPGDLLVVNDAGTLPASLPGVLRGQPVEVRLAGPVDEGLAVLFGEGSWRDMTEHRPAPPRARVGDEVHGVGRVVEVLGGRLVRLAFSRSGVALWDWLYRVGRPVQYSYMERDLDVSEVQTPFASRPWAAEMPSAGRPLSESVLAGVPLARITHAAGLSSTGDAETDALLPLPERSDIPVETVEAVERASRVLAVGTSVARALEDRFARHGRLVPGVETSTLRIGPGTPLRVVDGLLSGMHEPGESHFELFKAFASPEVLLAANAEAVGLGYRNHEFGDSTLLL